MGSPCVATSGVSRSVTIRVAEEEDGLELLSFIRPDDAEEVEVAGGDLEQEVMTYIHPRHIALAVHYKGELACIAGVTDRGSIWMLATTVIDRVSPLLVARVSEEVFYLLQSLLPPDTLVRNLVWDQRPKTVKWLRWLGFDVSDPVHEVAGKRFHHFHVFSRSSDCDHSDGRLDSPAL